MRTLFERVLYLRFRHQHPISMKVSALSHDNTVGAPVVFNSSRDLESSELKIGLIHGRLTDSSVAVTRS